MPLPMFDLVAKVQGKVVRHIIYPDSNGLYLYKNQYKSLTQLARIGNIPSSTLASRFKRSTYATVEEAVDIPVSKKYRKKKTSRQS